MWCGFEPHIKRALFTLEGIEPTINQLIADCSTTELHAVNEAKLIRLVLPLCMKKFNKGEKQNPYLQKYLQAGLIGLEPTTT